MTLGIAKMAATVIVGVSSTASLIDRVGVVAKVVDGVEAVRVMTVKVDSVYDRVLVSDRVDVNSVKVDVQAVDRV